MTVTPIPPIPEAAFTFPPAVLVNEAPVSTTFVVVPLDPSVVASSNMMFSHPAVHVPPHVRLSAAKAVKKIFRLDA